MNGTIHEAVADGGVVVADRAALRAPSRTLSYESAVWIARAGRFGAIWLPIWAVCAVQLPTQLTAVVASLVLTGVWKAALRRAYRDASTTVWTIGAWVPGAVGAATGALLALPLLVWVPAFRLSLTTLLELTVEVFIASSLWETAVANSLAARRRVLLVGVGGGGSDLLEDVSLAPRVPFDVVGIVEDERETELVAGVPVLGGIDGIPAVVEELHPQIVVLAGGDREQALEGLVSVGHLGFSVVDLPEFYEYAFGRLPLRNLTAPWFLSILHLYRRRYSRLAKRTFDVIVACLGLLVVAPVLPVVAALVRRSGPVIFRQVRLGEAGKPFTIYKFRTMRVDAEANGAVWASEHDPRITPVGRFLRKTRLDELPQLWNVLKGEMSIVGPRPERPEFVAELEAEVPFWGRRHLVKPGVTGWAQVRRGYTADAAGTGDKLSYDLWYLRHRSLVVDLAICVKTFSTLVTASGAR